MFLFCRFYERSDTFSLGVCNGCQLMALLGWVPGCDDYQGILPSEKQPRFVHNLSGRFESRWSHVKVGLLHSLGIHTQRRRLTCLVCDTGWEFPVHNAQGYVWFEHGYLGCSR